MKVSLLSLGCPRNLVDSELILGSLKEDGHKIVDIEDRADIAIVNTCAFIESARRESIDAILEASRLKKKGRIRYLVVAGCLAQGYHRELRSELKEVDAFLGTSDLGRINELLGALRRKKGASIVSKIPDHLPGADAHRYALTPGHYAYLKISEGCGNLCSYCIISKLRGPFRSRPMGDILREAGELADRMRAKEIDIIGQDTTMYGSDIYGESCLAELLRRLAAMKTSVRWIRLLYTHPAHYTDALIETMAGEEKI
jgi:ribosomal protein S12 methylthiotransferase